MKNLQIAGLLLSALAIFATIGAAAVGWVFNLVALFSATQTGEIVLRAFGVIIPVVGAVAGYF